MDKLDKDLMERARETWYGDDHADVEITIRNFARLCQEVRDEALLQKDTSVHGTAIVRDGKRVDPEEVYKSPEEMMLQKERALSDRLGESLECSGKNPKHFYTCSCGKEALEDLRKAREG